MSFEEQHDPASAPPVFPAGSPASQRRRGFALFVALVALAALGVGLGTGALLAHARARPTEPTADVQAGGTDPGSSPIPAFVDSPSSTAAAPLPSRIVVGGRHDGVSPPPSTGDSVPAQAASTPVRSEGGATGETSLAQVTTTTTQVPAPKFTSVNASPSDIVCPKAPPYPTITISWKTVNATRVVVGNDYIGGPAGSYSFPAPCDSPGDTEMFLVADNGPASPKAQAEAQWHFIPPQ